jgi:hypothetical protein
VIIFEKFNDQWSVSQSDDEGRLERKNTRGSGKVVMGN